MVGENVSITPWFHSSQKILNKLELPSPLNPDSESLCYHYHRCLMVASCAILGLCILIFYPHAPTDVHLQSSSILLEHLSPMVPPRFIIKQITNNALEICTSLFLISIYQQTEADCHSSSPLAVVDWKLSRVSAKQISRLLMSRGCRNTIEENIPGKFPRKIPRESVDNRLWISKRPRQIVRLIS